ncbi:hypothetical protein GCM10027018_01860 [Paenibacillus thermoaerophilus]
MTIRTEKTRIITGRGRTFVRTPGLKVSENTYENTESLFMKSGLFKLPAAGQPVEIASEYKQILLDMILNVS